MPNGNRQIFIRPQKYGVVSWYDDVTIIMLSVLHVNDRYYNNWCYHIYFLFMIKFLDTMTSILK